MVHDATKYQRGRTRWTSAIWSGNQSELFPGDNSIEKGRKFEELAQRGIFPRLAISSAVNLATLAAHAPFDFMADMSGQRVAIDVSSKWQKRVGDKGRLAVAFRFPLFVLLISPRDPSFFFFTQVRDGQRSVRVPFDLLRNMATAFGETHHGR